MGVTVTINQTLAADTAEFLVKEFGHNPIREEKAEESSFVYTASGSWGIRKCENDTPLTQHGAKSGR